MEYPSIQSQFTQQIWRCSSKISAAKNAEEISFDEWTGTRLYFCIFSTSIKRQMYLSVYQSHQIKCSLVLHWPFSFFFPFHSQRYLLSRLKIWTNFNQGKIAPYSLLKKKIKNCGTLFRKVVSAGNEWSDFCSPITVVCTRNTFWVQLGPMKPFWSCNSRSRV